MPEPTKSTRAMFRVTIEAPIQDVWDEITRTDEPIAAFFNSRMDVGTLAPGSRLAMRTPDGKYTGVVGEILEFDPPRRFAHTFRFTNYDDPPCTVTYTLEKVADGTLGGIFCSQVIEHVPGDALVALVRLAHAKLRPGAVLLCETPNPACLTVFSGAFYVDLTHVKPIHPEAARFVLEAAGFRDVEIRYANPYPPEAKLQPLEPLWYMRRYEEAFLTALNDNFARLNDLLWGAQDYAVIGRKA